MERIQTYEAVEPNAFVKYLVNLRIQLDGTAAIVDLIPSRPKSEIVENPQTDFDPHCFMRVHFSSIHAISIQEEFVEIFDVLNVRLKDIPKLSSGGGYPFLRVINSKWKSCLPKHQGIDNPNLEHYKFLSLETFIDVLGFLEKVEWRSN